jgi:hypothetical protein
MNLQELLATNLADLKSYCLVFTAELAQVLQIIQNEYGSKRHIPLPRQLIDGRHVLGADILTEVHPGGLYHQGWQYLPQERFNEVEVMLWNDVIPLLPVEPDIEEFSS